METLIQKTEEWRPVVGYEGLYEVSNLGRVRTVPKIRKLAEDEDGYLRVALAKPGKKKKLIGVHCLVLEAFKGPRPPGNVGRHLDGKPSNNVPDNLAWGTPQENWDDARRHGTAQIGGANGSTKLTDFEVLQIRALRAQGLSYPKIAARFGIGAANARFIATKQTWKHL